MSKTILAKTGKIVWKLLQEHGHNPEAVFNELEINPAIMDIPGARVGHEVVNKLWSKITTLIDIPSFGLRAVKYWHPSFFDALGYAWMASSSLRTAFIRLDRYLQTVSEIVDLQMEDTAEGFLVTYTPRAFLIDFPARTDIAMAVFINMCRVNIGEDFSPLRVTLTHKENANSDEYAEYFRCPIEYQAKTNSFLIATEIMDQPLDGANPQLANLNDQLMIKALARLSRDNIEQRVKVAIIEQLPSGEVSQAMVANELHMSVRNLQRKLQGIDTSFRSLLEQTRMELAKQYVNDSSVSLGEVSFLLGFAEPSSFSRAYKRWFGTSPQELRKTEYLHFIGESQ